MMKKELTLCNADITNEEIGEAIKRCRENEYTLLSLPYNDLFVVEESDQIRTSALISFPYGNDHIQIKIAQIKKAVEFGAKTVDVVLRFSLNWASVKQEIEMLKAACKESGVSLRLIVEYRLYIQKSYHNLLETCLSCGDLILILGTGTIRQPAAENVDVCAHAADLGFRVVGGPIWCENQIAQYEKIRIDAVRFQSCKI